MSTPMSTTATSTGLAANTAGALAYLIGPITGAGFLLIEKENRFVRYHAAQSITVGLLLIAVYSVTGVVDTLLSVVPVLGWMLGLLLTIGLAVGSFVLWVALMYRAWQGRETSVPVAGPLARKLAGQQSVTTMALVGAMALSAAAPHPASAQFLGRLKNAVKQRVEDKAVAKSDSAVDKVMDHKKKDGNADGSSANAPGTASTAPRSRAEWANYDFVPGARAIYFTDFTDEEVGNFPRHMELKGGQAEIVELDGGQRALKASSPTDIIIPLDEALPEKFTIEVDVINRRDRGVAANTFEIAGGRNLNDTKYTQVGWGQDGTTANGGGVDNTLIPAKDVDKQRYTGNPASFRILADGKALKLYVDEKRLANLPNTKFMRGHALVLRLEARDDEKEAVYVTRIRVAESQKDIYDELAANGRWSTQGILFDSGESDVKPESTPTLKSIAAALKGHPSLHVEIQGHTDNVGSASSNMTLSQARAEAVKQALVKDYGVSASQMTAKGYGDTKPLASNDTPEGRANNRRVELVKK